MALLYHYIPCTKTIHRLHKKFQENSGVDPASSPKAEIASPNYMESVKRLTKGETQIDPTQEVKMATNAGSLKERVKLGQGKGRTLEIPKRGK